MSRYCLATTHYKGEITSYDLVCYYNNFSDSAITMFGWNISFALFDKIMEFEENSIVYHHDLNMLFPNLVKYANRFDIKLEIVHNANKTDITSIKLGKVLFWNFNLIGGLKISEYEEAYGVKGIPNIEWRNCENGNKRFCIKLTKAMKEILNYYEKETGLKRFFFSQADAAMKYYKNITPEFDEWFPQFPVELEKARKCMLPAILYMREKTVKKSNNGAILDDNSLYPFCAKHFPLPYGLPVDYETDCWIGNFLIECEEKENSIPFLTHNLEHNMWLTNVDWYLLNKYYNVKSSICLDKIYFKSQKGMFDKYIDHWYYIKKTAIGGRRQVAKDMMNKLLGKFGTKLYIANYNYEEGNAAGYAIHKNKTYYWPVEAFVLSYGRYWIMENANKIGLNRINYIDTDSFHLDDYDVAADAIKIGDGIGEFKVEHRWSDICYRNLKYYAFIENDVSHIRAAGMPTAFFEDGVSIKTEERYSFDDFVKGFVIKDAITRRTKDGIVKYDYVVEKESEKEDGRITFLSF